MAVLDKSNTRQLAQAVDILIHHDKYSQLIKEITEIVERWDTYPMAYAGHLVCLNALIELGLSSRAAFENVVKLIEDKRRAIPATKRIDYQRALMQARRARVAKALELHERSGKTIKSTAERRTLELQIQKRWSKAKMQFIKEKGKLSWKQRNAAMNEFWADIDATLDQNLRATRKETA